jgi:hypothetical protein
VRLVFLGAQFWPFCATERWALVSPLEPFGTLMDFGPEARKKGARRVSAWYPRKIGARPPPKLAAHPVSPFQGQGANMAMLVALRPAEVLSGMMHEMGILTATPASSSPTRVRHWYPTNFRGVLAGTHELLQSPVAPAVRNHWR